MDSATGDRDRSWNNTAVLTHAFLTPKNITTRPVDATTGEKEYKVQDHLGSTRLMIAESGTVAGQYDYDAWGTVIWQSDAPPRKGFIDKEKDAESGDHNFGVRQYGDGRFTSTDPLWEKYRSWSPYNYAENNPLRFKDPSGFGPGDASRIQPTWTNEYSGGIIGGSGGNGGVSIGQIVGAAVAGVLGYVFAENVVGTESEQKTPPPATSEQTKENTNPFAGPVGEPVIVVDPAGNAIPVAKGEQVQGSPDGTFQQVKDSKGIPTGVRKDGPHGPSHSPEGKQPHAHRPDVPGVDYWLPIRSNNPAITPQLIDPARMP